MLILNLEGAELVIGNALLISACFAGLWLLKYRYRIWHAIFGHSQLISWSNGKTGPDLETYSKCRCGYERHFYKVDGKWKSGRIED